LGGVLLVPLHHPSVTPFYAVPCLRTPTRVDLVPDCPHPVLFPHAASPAIGSECQFGIGVHIVVRRTGAAATIGGDLFISPLLPRPTPGWRSGFRGHRLRLPPPLSPPPPPSPPRRRCRSRGFARRQITILSPLPSQPPTTTWCFMGSLPCFLSTHPSTTSNAASPVFRIFFLSTSPNILDTPKRWNP